MPPEVPTASFHVIAASVSILREGRRLLVRTKEEGAAAMMFPEDLAQQIGQAFIARPIAVSTAATRKDPATSADSHLGEEERSEKYSRVSERVRAGATWKEAAAAEGVNQQKAYNFNYNRREAAPAS